MSENKSIGVSGKIWENFILAPNVKGDYELQVCLGFTTTFNIISIMLPLAVILCMFLYLLCMQLISKSYKLGEVILQIECYENIGQ